MRRNERKREEGIEGLGGAEVHRCSGILPAAEADDGGDFVGSLAEICLGFVGASREEDMGVYMG